MRQDRRNQKKIEELMSKGTVLHVHDGQFCPA